MPSSHDHAAPRGGDSLVGTTRFSVLDRSRTREGHHAAEALRDTVRLAQELEGLGYHRIWVSEHHGVPGVAGSAPTVLTAAIAAATRTIRVGTGGVKVLVTTSTYDREALLESFRRLAGVAGLITS